MDIWIVFLLMFLPVYFWKAILYCFLEKQLYWKSHLSKTFQAAVFILEILYEISTAPLCISSSCVLCKATNLLSRQQKNKKVGVKNTFLAFLLVFGEGKYLCLSLYVSSNWQNILSDFFKVSLCNILHKNKLNTRINIVRMFL